MITGFGEYTPESSAEPIKSDQIDGELFNKLLDVLETGLSGNESRFEEVKVALIGLVETDGLTGKYTGKLGAFLEEIRATVKGRNADLERSVQVINELNPNKMYGQMRETLQVEQQAGWDKMKADHAGFHKILAETFDELQAKRQQDIAATNQNVTKILHMQEGVDRSLGQIYNKIDKGITGQNADMQDTKATVQTAMYDMGALFAQSLKETAYFKKISEQLVVAVFGALALLCITTVLLFFRSPDAATPRVQADFVKKYVQDVDSLESIIKENGYQKRARKH